MTQVITQQPADDDAEHETHCECVAWGGERCQWTGPASDMIVVEWMPTHLRDSHEAAGSEGFYPSNGAQRSHVSPECADVMIKYDGGWCTIVEEG